VIVFWSLEIWADWYVDEKDFYRPNIYTSLSLKTNFERDSKKKGGEQSFLHSYFHKLRNFIDISDKNKFRMTKEINLHHP
jgi:hypothetical protein